MFGVRAFVTGAFQAAYVYTPEVRRRFVWCIEGLPEILACTGDEYEAFLELLLSLSGYFLLSFYIFLEF